MHLDERGYVTSRPTTEHGAIEAACRTSLASSQLVNFTFGEPVDDTLLVEDPVVDLCLTPRPVGACARFANWETNRFEKIGDVFFLPAGMEAHTRASSGRQRSVISRFNSDMLARWFGGELEWTDRALSSTLNINSMQVRQLMQRIARELVSPGFASEMMIELLNMQLAVELARYFRDMPERFSGGLSPWRLRMIDDRIGQFESVPSLEELASLVGMSVRQLTRGFRNSRGISIGAYVDEQRAEEARRLLGTDLSIKDIAWRLGFASPSGFSYAFRKATGETPRSFRSSRSSASIGGARPPLLR